MQALGPEYGQGPGDRPETFAGRHWSLETLGFVGLLVFIGLAVFTAVWTNQSCGTTGFIFVSISCLEHFQIDIFGFLSENWIILCEFVFTVSWRTTYTVWTKAVLPT